MKKNGIQSKAPVIPRWRLTILDNNYTRESACIAEHGLSLLLERLADGALWLLDTGSRGETLLHNARALAVDWTKLRAVVLSHGHYDHSGGLRALFDVIGHRVQLVAHPDAFLPKFAGAARMIGSPVQPADLPASRLELRLIRESQPLAEGLIVTGEVPRREAIEEEAVRGFSIERQGERGPDRVADDMSLVLKTDAGYVLVCGCCHSGLVNTIRHANALAGEAGPRAIIGGFHTIGASQARLDFTAAALEKLELEFLAPLHCAGARETAFLYARLGERVKFLSVGESVEF